MLQSHVPHQSHAPQQQQQQMGAFQYSAFNAAAQVPQMDALEMQLASMQGMPGYGKACSIPNRCLACRKEHILAMYQSICIPSLQGWISSRDFASASAYLYSRGACSAAAC